MTPDVDVLVCGAGAAGLTLAVDLARRGESFRLVDKLDSAFAGSRGKAVQPRSQEVFEDLGVLDRLVAVGGEYPVQRRYHDDGSFDDVHVMEPVPATPAEPYHIPLMVPQFLTEGVLRERLTELGHAVEFGCELVGFEQDADGVTARLRTRGHVETVRARYLVGTDGGRSFVRNALGSGFPGRTLGVRAVVADVDLAGVGRDAWHTWRGGGDGMVALCPLAGTELFQLQATVPLDGDVDVSADGLARLVRERTGRSDIPVRSVVWASVYSMSARLSDHYRSGRVLIAGDAAHVHPPTGGQGLNTSVQDAYNLGWKLAAVLDGAADALLDSYEEERRSTAAAMLGLATGLLDGAKQGEMRRGRDVGQLDIGYPGSSLAVGTSVRTGAVLAGDRAPDAPLVGAAGRPARLFELMKGPHWTAVGYRAARDTGPAPRRGLHIHRVDDEGDVRDDAGHFAAAYGLGPGDWVLIRPDGYVGGVVGPAGVAVLGDYLQRFQREDS